MSLFVQNLFESTLSILLLAIHLSILRSNIEMNTIFVFLLYLTRCFSRNLMGPLSWVVLIDGHVSLWQ